METTWLLQDDLPKETNWDVQLLWIILCSDLRNLQASHPQTWLFYPSIWPFQIFLPEEFKAFCRLCRIFFVKTQDLPEWGGKYGECWEVLIYLDVPLLVSLPLQLPAGAGNGNSFGIGNSDSKRRVLFHRTIFQGEFYFHFMLNRVQSQETSAGLSCVPTNGIWPRFGIAGSASGWEGREQSWVWCCLWGVRERTDLHKTGQLFPSYPLYKVEYYPGVVWLFGNWGLFLGNTELPFSGKGRRGSCGNRRGCVPVLRVRNKLEQANRYPGSSTSRVKLSLSLLGLN